MTTHDIKAKIANTSDAAKELARKGEGKVVALGREAGAATEKVEHLVQEAAQKAAHGAQEIATKIVHKGEELAKKAGNKIKEA